jgi:hypothetical protein
VSEPKTGPKKHLPKRGEFWERHSVLAWAVSLATVLSVLLFADWLCDWLRALWRSGGLKSYLAAAVVGLVMFQDLVHLYRRDWSQRSTFSAFEIRRVWSFLLLAFLLFVGGLIALLTGKIEERILGGAVSLLIGVGYFRLRAAERRKQPLRPSPWFFWF